MRCRALCAHGMLFNVWHYCLNHSQARATIARPFPPRHCGRDLIVWYVAAGCQRGGGSSLPSRMLLSPHVLVGVWGLFSHVVLSLLCSSGIRDTRLALGPHLTAMQAPTAWSVARREWCSSSTCSPACHVATIRLTPTPIPLTGAVSKVRLLLTGQRFFWGLTTFF